MGPWMQGREVPRRALSASVGESSLELQLSLTLSSLAVFFSLEKGVWELFNCTVSSLNEPVCVSVYMCV